MWRKQRKGRNDAGVGGIKSPAVDETGLPRTTRHLFQCLDVDVGQLDTSLSDFVDRVGGVDGGVFHFLNKWVNSLYVAQSPSAKGTHLDKIPQLFRNFLD